MDGWRSLRPTPAFCVCGGQAWFFLHTLDDRASVRHTGIRATVHAIHRSTKVSTSFIFLSTTTREVGLDVEKRRGFRYIEPEQRVSDTNRGHGNRPTFEETG